MENIENESWFSYKFLIMLKVVDVKSVRVKTFDL